MKFRILSLLGVILLCKMAFADLIGNEVGVYKLFDVMARTTAVGSYGSPVIDRSAFLSGVVQIQSALSTAGTSCTLSVVLQHADYDTLGVLNNKSYTDTTSIGLRDNAARNAIGCQLTQDSARQISSVTILAKKLGTITATNKIWCRIETNNAGAPSGTLFHPSSACTLLVTAVTSSYKWVTFTFAKPFDVAASSVIHLVLSGDYTASGSNYIRVANDDVASAGNFECMATATWADSATMNFFGFNKVYNFQTISGSTLGVATETYGVFTTKDFDLRGKKRYLRAKVTSVGTSASFVSDGLIILGESYAKPVLE